MLKLSKSNGSSILKSQRSPEQTFKDQINEYDQKYKTLIDYMTVIGIDNQDLHKAFKSTQKQQETSFTPKVLSRVPHIERPNVAFPNQISDFCFPDKIQIKKDKGLMEDQEIVLTGADGQNIYIVCLTFREDMYDIQQAIQSFKDEEKLQAALGQTQNAPGLCKSKSVSDRSLQSNQGSRRNSHRSLKKSSLLDNEMQFEEKKEDIKNSFKTPGKLDLKLKRKTTMLQIDDIKDDFKDILPNSEEDIVHFNKNQYFMPKAICLLSRYPFFEQFKSILEDLKSFIDSGLKAPLEDYFAHLVYSIPAPPRGLAKIVIRLPGKQETQAAVPLMMPSINKLPYTNNEFIRTLFSCLDLDNILYFFKRILLDSNNLMVCSDRNKLVQVGEAIKSLVYPFKFELIYVPYLPPSLIDYLNAPMPYLMGVVREKQKEAEGNLNEGAWVINFDNNTINEKGGTNTSIRSTRTFKDDFPDLPSHYAKKLHSQLYKILGTFSKEKKHKKLLTDLEIQSIRNSFFQFFVGVFQNVFQPEYWMHAKMTSEEISSNFNINKFIDNEKNDSKPFLKMFSKLHMFTRFIERKKWPTQNDDVIDITFFEENVKLKKKKSIKNYKKTLETPFLDDESHSFYEEFDCKELIQINKPYDILIDPAKDFFKDNEMIMVDMCDSIVNEERVTTYRYKIIPWKLNQKYLQRLFNNECFTVQRLREFKMMEEQQISRLPNQAGDQDKTNRKVRVQKWFNQYGTEVNVLLSWILIWAATLSHMDKRKEHQFRQNQLIEVLVKLKQKFYINRLEIFEILADSIYKYGSPKMLLQIIDLLEEFGLKPNAALMTYMLNAISKSSYTIKDVQAQRRKKLLKIETHSAGQGQIDNKIRGELVRRILQTKASNSQSSERSHPHHLKSQDDHPKYSFLDTKSPFYSHYYKDFKTRTFLYAEELEDFTSERVSLLIKEKCDHCSLILYSKDLLKYQLRESEETLNFYCQCKNLLFPNLKVRIGDYIKHRDEDTIFMNHLQLRQYVEDKLKLDQLYRNAEQVRPVDLKYHHKNVYWNLIWYFSEYDLPYDFLIQYESQEVYEEFLKLNMHIKARNKLRPDQIAKREMKEGGGIDKYIEYLELQQAKQQARKDKLKQQKLQRQNLMRGGKPKKEKQEHLRVTQRADKTKVQVNSFKRARQKLKKRSLSESKIQQLDKLL